jgi:hypothetical protein
MVRRLVLSTSAISSSGRPFPKASSANRRMRAWQNVRAAPRPLEMRRSHSTRSSAVNVTRYFSIAGPLFFKNLLEHGSRKQYPTLLVNRRLTTH